MFFRRGASTVSSTHGQLPSPRWHDLSVSTNSSPLLLRTTCRRRCSTTVPRRPRPLGLNPARLLNLPLLALPCFTPSKTRETLPPGGSCGDLVQFLSQAVAAVREALPPSQRRARGPLSMGGGAGASPLPAAVLLHHLLYLGRSCPP